MDGDMIPVPICAKCEAPYTMHVGYAGSTFRHQWIYQSDCRCSAGVQLARYSPLPAPAATFDAYEGRFDDGR